MSNISTLTVISADKSKATDNASFASMEEEEKNVNLSVFLLDKNINMRIEDSTD